MCYYSENRAGNGRTLELGEVGLCLHFREQFPREGRLRGVGWRGSVWGTIMIPVDQREEWPCGWPEGAGVGDIWAGESPTLGNLRASQEQLLFLAQASGYRGFCAFLLSPHLYFIYLMGSFN